MENPTAGNNDSLEASDPKSGRQIERIVQIAYLILALAICALVLSAKARASETAVLAGNHSVEAYNLVARIPGDRNLSIDVTFALRNRDQLNRLLAAQQNPASRLYHRWLTPAQFDARFGRSAAEVAAVKQWFVSRGFYASHSSPRGLTLTASAAQAEAAFAVTIAASADGSVFGNIDDPQIPAQFAGVIGSIEGLDNLRHATPMGFRPPQLGHAPSSVAGSVANRRHMAPAGNIHLASIVDYSSGLGAAFGPADLYTFYNETPLLNAGTNGGGGDCLAVAEDSDYLDSAVTLFSSNFSLPAASLTRVLPDLTSPGRNGDEIETLLDIEWAHAVAPGAPIRVYIGSGGNALYDAFHKAVTDNACGAISISFSYCGGSSSFYTSTLDSVFAQAAAQGQSVFISSGDDGAAGVTLNSTGTACAIGTSRNVNEMGADPNVIAVGGTQFTPVFDGSNNDLGSVPESVWNDPAGATGGGASAYFAKPAFQSVGTPNDSKRDVPDISFGSSPYSPGFYWANDNSGTAVLTCCVGGTSIAAPMWAGLAKLVAHVNNGRLGNMNPRIYQLGLLGNAAQSGLRDVTSGNNNYNGVVGFTAGPGYDQSTGWGTADMATFAAAYTSSASPTPTPTPTITPTPTPTATPTPAPTPTPTPTSTPSPTPTPTPTPVPLTMVSSLPGGKVNVAYAASLGISGGTSPYTSTVASGSLPSGLTLGATTGWITGTPKIKGISWFTIKVVDSAKASTSKKLSISISK